MFKNCIWPIIRRWDIGINYIILYFTIDKRELILEIAEFLIPAGGFWKFLLVLAPIKELLI